MEFVEKVDLELFNKTKARWEAQLKANPTNVSETFYSAAIENCERHVREEVELGDGDGCVAGVVGDDGYAKALFIISHARGRSTAPDLKLLTLYVEPDLNAADRDPDIPQLATIAAIAIVGCLEMTYTTFPAKQLKIFTAIPLDKDFLQSIMTASFSRGQLKGKFRVSSHGNWLVAEKV